MGIRLDQIAAAGGLAEFVAPASGASTARRTAITPQSAPPPSPTVTPPAPPEVSTVELREAVAEINEALQSLQLSLNIIHDDASGRSVVVVRDADGNVVRQMPPDQVLRALAQVQKVVGLLFDEAV